MTEVNKERVALLVAALRSGDYTQGRGLLKAEYPDGVRHCPLGVAEEVKGSVSRIVSRSIFDEDRGRTRHGFPTTVYGGSYLERAVLTEEGREWYGFDDLNPLIQNTRGNDVRVTEANDGLRWTLAKIADGFERKYLA